MEEWKEYNWRLYDELHCPFCGSTDIYETYSQEYALGTKNPEIFCNTCISTYYEITYFAPNSFISSDIKYFNY